MRTCTFAYQGVRSVNFSEYFANVPMIPSCIPRAFGFLSPSSQLVLIILLASKKGYDISKNIDYYCGERTCCREIVISLFHFKPLVPNAPFLYPLKHQKTLGFSNVFRGREKVHCKQLS